MNGHRVKPEWDVPPSTQGAVRASLDYRQNDYSLDDIGFWRGYLIELKGLFEQDGKEWPWP